MFREKDNLIRLLRQRHHARCLDSEDDREALIECLEQECEMIEIEMFYLNLAMDRCSSKCLDNREELEEVADAILDVFSISKAIQYFRNWNKYGWRRATESEEKEMLRIYYGFSWDIPPDPIEGCVFRLEVDGKNVATGFAIVDDKTYINPSALCPEAKSTT